MRRAYRDMLIGAVWCACVLLVGSGIAWVLWQVYRLTR